MFSTWTGSGGIMLQGTFALHAEEGLIRFHVENFNSEQKFEIGGDSDTSESVGIYIRGLYEAWNRNPDSDIATLIEAFINVQVGFLCTLTECAMETS